MTMLDVYKTKTVPALKETFGYKNMMAVPKIEKVVLNVGLGKGLTDSSYIETAENTLKRISGQKPVPTRAKKSISNFKIREGMVIGMKVTLRGEKMYEFLDKLVHITLPRVRDFRGLSPKAIDKDGNFNIGIKEHISFPEISADEVEKVHGLEISIVTTAHSREEGRALFESLGFPLKNDEKK